MYRYLVHACADHPDELQAKLNEVAKDGGRVVSVVWGPERFYKLHQDYKAGYVIVAEYANA